MHTQPTLSNRVSLLWHRQLPDLLSKLNRGLAFGVIMFGALLAFELFNYTTTDFALQDFLGNISFLGLRWSMILAIAFCGMDFAGIARLFAPAGEKGAKVEVWYLLGAWFLAATMNAMLTWWGVSLALLQHQELGNEILSREQLIRIVPVFVAVLVWLIRILMIGTFSMAGERLFARAEEALHPAVQPQLRPAAQAAARPVRMLGVAEEDDFDQFGREQRPVRQPNYREERPREERARDERPREERPRPVTPPPAEVRRVPVERPVVPPPMPAVRPAPKPSVATAQALGATNGARAAAPRPMPVNGHQEMD